MKKLKGIYEAPAAKDCYAWVVSSILLRNGWMKLKMRMMFKSYYWNDAQMQESPLGEHKFKWVKVRSSRIADWKKVG